MKKLNSTYIIIGVLSVLVIVGIGGAVYYQQQAQKAEYLLKNPDAVAKQETKDVVAKVGKLMVLPTETPQIATILDKTKLAGQPFFANAQNGDRVLVFTKAQKAVLYRPSTNLIVEVGPLTMPTAPTATESAAPASSSAAPAK